MFNRYNDTSERFQKYELVASQKEVRPGKFPDALLCSDQTSCAHSHSKPKKSCEMGWHYTL